MRFWILGESLQHNMVSMSSSSFPGFAHLYCLEDSGSRRSFIAELDLGGVNALAATRGIVEVARARARWAMGASAPGPVLWTTSLFPVLLSKGLAEELRRRGVAGWTTYPVDVTGRNGEELGEYCGLVVIGRCGPVDMERSETVSRSFPGGMFPMRRGLFFEESSWDGSDIFMSSKEAFIFVTGRAKQAFEESGASAKFEALSTIETKAPKGRRP